MACNDQISEEMKDPRYKMLQSELRGLNVRMDALLNINLPKPFIMDILVPISKAAVFADTRVECIGADLISISTDGDLTDISYRIIQLDGSTSQTVEASEIPQFPGPITAILLNNVAAEAGKTIRVARVQGSQLALAAFQHGTPMAISIASSKRLFYAEAAEYVVSAEDLFEDDEPISAVAPTHFMTGVPLASHIMIHGVKYQMIPTAAVTYQLYLLEAATAEQQQQEAEIIYDSGAGIVAGAVVFWVPGGAPSRLPAPARLAAPGIIWYKIDWSAAPGNTAGYIRVYGEVMG